jgi:hypothetical protein
VFLLRKFEKESVWAKNNKKERAGKEPGFDKANIYRLVVLSFLGNDMPYQR